MKKTWAERLNDTPELESDADEQLLMYIPYDTPHLPFYLRPSCLPFARKW